MRGLERNSDAITWRRHRNPPDGPRPRGDAPHAGHRRVSRSTQTYDALPRSPDHAEERFRLGHLQRSERRPARTGAPAVLVENAAESAVFCRHIGVLPALAGKLLRNEVIRADSGSIDRVMQL